MKLINSLFDRKILGDSRYLVDEFFFSAEDMHYHFFCMKCSGMLPQIDFKHQKGSVSCVIRECQFVNEVKDFKKESYFVTFDIPTQLEFLFQDEKIRSQLIDPFSVIDFAATTMRDLYHGSSYKKFVIALDRHADCKYLSFTACADQSPLYKSSKCSITPCFLMVNELPVVTRMKNLLVVGLWFGSKKVKIDFFLKPVVDEINELSEPGFSVLFGEAEAHFKAYLLCGCFDSGARGEAQGIHTHRGEFGCNWCLHPGEEYKVGKGRSRRYRFEFPFHDLRTAEQMLRDWDESLRTRTIVHGCTTVSPLASARYFNIVDGMIYNYMHNFCEGNVKKFLQLWLSNKQYLSEQ